MNYYEHHIGDYAEATLHLSFIEDAAYSRLIRKYYSTERPIPADFGAAQRLVGARTKEEKAAVEVVLKEFFSLRDDGWHQQRCDDEIEKFAAGEPEREAKATNELVRQRRHREERATLFAKLNAFGQHLAWNTPIDKVREAVAKLDESVSTGNVTGPAPVTPTVTPVTRPVTAPVTPATATQTPDTRHQTPDTSKKKGEGARAPLLTFDAFTAQCRATNVPAIPEDDPVIAYAEKAGISPEMLRLAWGSMKKRYSGEKKRYRDWRKVFRNAVEGNWFHLWYVDGHGHVVLTTAGKLTEKAEA